MGDDERERRVEAIFGEAMDVPPADRAAVARRECGADAGLLARVLSLLDVEGEAEAEEFLSDPTVGVPSTAVGTVGAGAEVRLGRYRLLEQIGEGGFGVVFRAEQDRPVRRQVAVKVIKLGMDTREVVARFEAERQALAVMGHPNIATVFDAGATAAGRPYFVMELVSGSPITDYCDDHRLGAADRIGLLARVCRAVQHAHGKGVIHRDLKPSNVLVTAVDGTPVPKVIDFGIVKATGGRPAGRTPFTAVRQLIGTPQYMSPEQADGDGADVDTRADVYSLGVVLYELLVGATPHDGARLRSATADEVRRVIRDVDPPRPSTRLSTLGGDVLGAVAAARGTEPARLGQAVRGELDWIVRRALEKDRGRRYDTAAALADDLERYLAGEAVLAGPPGGVYRLRKAAGRHRAAIAVAATVGVALAAGVAGTTVGLVREAAARAVAVRERADAVAQRAEADRLRGVAEARYLDLRGLAHDLMFTIDDALVDVAGTTRARRLLAATAGAYLDRLGRGAADDPALDRDRAASYMRVGDILGNPRSPNVGDSAAALASYRKMLGLTLKRARSAPDDPAVQRDLGLGYGRVGDLERATGRTADAADSYDRALAACRARAAANPNDPDARSQVANAFKQVGDVRVETGRTAEAAADYAAEMAVVRAGADPVDRMALVVAYDDLGNLKARTGRAAEALAEFAAAEDLCRQLARDPSGGVQGRRNLAVLYGQVGVAEAKLGRTAEAVADCRAGVDLYRELVARDAADVQVQLDRAEALVRLAEAEVAAGRPDEAMADEVAALAAADRIVAADPAKKAARSQAAGCHQRIGDLQAAAGRSADALASYRAELAGETDLCREDPADDNSRRNLSIAHGRVGDAEVAAGRTADAAASFDAALAIARQRAGADPADLTARRDLADAVARVGGVRRAVGKAGEAAACYDEALALYQRTAAESPDEVKVRQDLAAAYDDVGDCRAAAGDVAGATASYAREAEVDGQWVAADPDNGVARRSVAVAGVKVADMLAAAGRGPEAVDAYRRSVETFERLAATTPGTADGRRDVATAYARLATALAVGRPAEALADHERSLALFRDLLRATPADPRLRRDVLLACTQVGDLRFALGRPADAMTAFDESRRIAADLSAADPASADGRRDLAVAHMKVAGTRMVLVAHEPADREAAGLKAGVAELREARALFDGLKSQGGLLPVDGATLVQLDKCIAQCDAAVSQLGAPAATRPATGPAR